MKLADVVAKLGWDPSRVALTAGMAPSELVVMLGREALGAPVDWRRLRNLVDTLRTRQWQVQRDDNSLSVPVAPPDDEEALRAIKLRPAEADWLDKLEACDEWGREMHSMSFGGQMRHHLLAEVGAVFMGGVFEGVEIRKTLPNRIRITPRGRAWLALYRKRPVT